MAHLDAKEGAQWPCTKPFVLCQACKHSNKMKPLNTLPLTAEVNQIV